MQSILILLAVVTAILMVAWQVARLLRYQPAAQDLLWRTTLIVIAMTPVALLTRSVLTNHQWSLRILPAISTDATSTQADPGRVPTETLQAGDQLNWKMRPLSRTTIPDVQLKLELERDDVVAVPAANNVAASSSESTMSTTSTLVADRTSTRDWPTLLAVAMTVIWPSGLVWHLIRIIRGAWNANRLLRQSSIVNDAAALELNYWCARRVGLSVATRLATHDVVTGPVVMGLITPTVVIPPKLLLPTARHDLRATLLHENGHLRRHDLPFDLLLRLVAAVLWFHPLVWVMARELRRLREELCDNHVLREERPVTYAEMLLRLALDQRQTESLLIGLGMFTRPHRLEARVDAILSSQRSLATSTTRRTRRLVFVVTSVCLVGALFLRVERARLAADDVTNAHEASTAPKQQLNADQQANANEPALESKPATITFKIVDASGKPIEGVAVTPWALSISGGAFFTDHNWDTSKTDAEGRVVIPLTVGISQTVTAVLKQSDVAGIDSIGFKAEHPNYPIWSNYLRLKGENPTLALNDPVTIQVRAQREGESGAATRLYPDISDTHSQNWSEANGILTYRNLDLSTSHWLRVAHFPDAGPAWFSDVVDLRHLAGDTISLSVTLKPGARVTGRLTADVPRPVKNGRIIGSVVSSLSADYSQSIWSVTTKIAEDGSFALESLPADETLQLIAICDGWVSRSPLKAETEAYAQQHGFPKGEASDPTAGMVLPQLLRLDARDISTTVPMTATGSFEITAVDDKTGQPMGNVEIEFSPNQLFHQGGTTFLGSGYDEPAAARAKLAGQKDDIKTFKIDPERRYQAKTNDQGVAVIGGLPGMPEDSDLPRQMMFFAHSDTHVGFPEDPLKIELPFYVQPLIARVTTGKTERMTIRMMPISEMAGETQDDLVATGTKSVVRNPGSVIGRVEDERGKPIEGVTVKIELMQEAIEIEAAPPEVKAEFERLSNIAVQTDREGRFVFPLQGFCGEEDDVGVPLRFTKTEFADHVQMVHSTEGRMMIRMHAGTSLTGTVHQVDGKPAANVVIRAYHELRFPGQPMEDQLVWHETMSDDRGQYKLLVQPDEYQIMARASDGEVAWLPKQTSTDGSKNQSARSRNNRTKLNIRRHEARQLDIQLEKAVEFRAMAINSLTGEPLAGIWFQQDDYPWIDSRTDETGNVTIRSLPAGTINFRFTSGNYHRAWSDGAASAWKERHFQDQTTKAGMVSINDGITFDLKPGMLPAVVSFEPAVKVTGRVVDPDGQPLGGIEVMSVREAGSSHATTSRPGWARTASDGRFELHVSAPEEGHIVLMGSDQRPVDRTPNATPGEFGRRSWANGFSQSIQALPGEKIENIELRMTRSGSIRGRIVTPDGQPMAAVSIQASSVQYLEEQRYSPSTTSDRNGQFILTYVGRGRYKLHGKIDSDGPSFRSATPEIDVQSGQTVDVGDVVIPLIEDVK